LLEDDELLKDGGAPAFAKYNRDQFFPVELPNGSKVFENELFDFKLCVWQVNVTPNAILQTLITAHGEIDQNTYFDPKSKQSFEFDHLRKEVSNMQDYVGMDEEAEPWR
jgi:capping protein alpha